MKQLFFANFQLLESLVQQGHLDYLVLLEQQEQVVNLDLPVIYSKFSVSLTF